MDRGRRFAKAARGAVSDGLRERGRNNAAFVSTITAISGWFSWLGIVAALVIWLVNEYNNYGQLTFHNETVDISLKMAISLGIYAGIELIVWFGSFAARWHATGSIKTALTFTASVPMNYVDDYKYAPSKGQGDHSEPVSERNIMVLVLHVMLPTFVCGFMFYTVMVYHGVREGQVTALTTLAAGIGFMLMFFVQHFQILSYSGSDDKAYRRSINFTVGIAVLFAAALLIYAMWHGFSVSPNLVAPNPVCTSNCWIEGIGRKLSFSGLVIGLGLLLIGTIASGMAVHYGSRSHKLHPDDFIQVVPFGTMVWALFFAIAVYTDGTNNRLI